MDAVHSGRAEAFCRSVASCPDCFSGLSIVSRSFGFLQRTNCAGDGGGRDYSFFVELVRTVAGIEIRPDAALGHVVILSSAQLKPIQVHVLLSCMSSCF